MNTITRLRDISRVRQTPPPQPGFVGEGHTAVQVVSPAEFQANDPFIVLMDDRVDLNPGSHVGEAHPHAGFEIATFVVEGELRDRDEGILRTGDVMWTSAGSGVIHNEETEAFGPTRILQLWFTLPSALRWSVPRFTHMSREAAPLREDGGATARVYSGSSGSVHAPPHTHLPLTMVDIHLEKHATFEQEVPAAFNGFIYVLDGRVTIGSNTLVRGQVGWLSDASDAGGETCLKMMTSEETARVIFYAGARQGVPIVMHGPFVGETHEDLLRISKAYIGGKMPRVSQL